MEGLQNLDGNTSQVMKNCSWACDNTGENFIWEMVKAQVVVETLCK